METIRETPVRDDCDALRHDTAAEADEAAITAGSQLLIERGREMRRLSWNASLSLRLTKERPPSQDQLLKTRWKCSHTRLFLGQFFDSR